MNTFKAFFEISSCKNCPLEYEPEEDFVLAEQSIQLSSGRPACLILARTLTEMLPTLRPHADTYFVGIEGESFSCGGCTGIVHFHITDRTTVSHKNTATQGISLSSTSVMIGSINHFPPAELFQILNMHQKTGQVVLEFGKRDTGFAAFKDGQLIAARYGRTVNERAFYDMLAEKKGTFRFQPELPEFLLTAKEIGDFMTILMEGLRLLDEGDEEEDLMQIVQQRKQPSD